jgi:hypothetical protein
VQPGARVRVEAPGIVAGRYVGTVLTRTADTITVGSPTGAPVVVPTSRLTGLEISRGKSRTAGAVRGMMWGVPIGLAAGLISLGAYEDCSSGGGCGGAETKGTLVMLTALSGAAWGAAIGAIVGREAWDSYELGPRASIGVLPHGVTLGMRLSLR